MVVSIWPARLNLVNTKIPAHERRPAPLEHRPSNFTPLASAAALVSHASSQRPLHSTPWPIPASSLQQGSRAGSRGHIRLEIAPLLHRPRSCAGAVSREVPLLTPTSLGNGGESATRASAAAPTADAPAETVVSVHDQFSGDDAVRDEAILVGRCCHTTDPLKTRAAAREGSWPAARAGASTCPPADRPACITRGTRRSSGQRPGRRQRGSSPPGPGLSVRVARRSPGRLFAWDCAEIGAAPKR